MQITNRRSAKILACRRLLVVAAVLALVCGFAEIVHAQNGVNPLTLFKNYFVTGDYVVGGVGLRGLGVNGWATGTISIPDGIQATATGKPSSSVPPGAEIVAAFLYWQTVESSSLVFAGQNGFFNGYAISGKVLGNPNAPVPWGEGGCSGEPEGTRTLRTYRADVRPYLPLDANGKVNANGHFQVKLTDSGAYGLNTPSTLGASVVVIYRLLASGSPLNAIILLDGTFAASTPTLVTTQTIPGFYQAASPIPVAELTEIVGNGRPGRTQTVSVNGVNLPSLYPANPPFPGIYNHSWDNPTWKSGLAVNANDSSATTSIVPGAEPFGEDDNGCVTSGATVFSTTVQSSDGDGLLDTWKALAHQGYTDVNTGEWVALPGATPGKKDIFIQVDYLNALLSGSPHSHLPQKATLDAVGTAYSLHGINVHFDMGPTLGTVFAGDQYVIPYPLPVGPGATPPPAGTGGHGIMESSVVCTDAPGALCEFPGQPAISWKTGFENVKSQNFWNGRKDSYRYLLYGHTLGMPTSTWSATGEVLPNTLNGVLVSIVNAVHTATVTIKTPLINPPIPIPSNASRVTISGALNNFALNGTYSPIAITNTTISGPPNPTTTTTFTITTAGVANGTYNFLNEPQLALAFGGPNSTSGFSDYGGADSLITLGLWPNFDPANCQADPSQALTPANPVYCADKVGTAAVQAGTTFHELGHPLTLTHGGTYFPPPYGGVGPMGQQINNPPFTAPTYGENCKPNFLSAMNYLFQIHGFPDGLPIDYSGQTLPNLSETALNETTGLGTDVYTGLHASHLTRWYAPPNASDIAIQNMFGGRFASDHCDGSPILDNAKAVRMDNTLTPAPNIDWNNNGVIDPGTLASAQDINFNGVIGDLPFQGFNDWLNLNLAQIGARRNVAGFSGAVTGADIFGGGADIFGGGADIFGGGADIFGGGADIFGGGADVFGGGAGFEVDFTAASSTLDPASNLSCTDCVLVIQSGLLTEQNGLSVPMTWTQTGFTGGGITQFTVWRAAGNFPTPAAVAMNVSSFGTIGTTTGTPALAAFVDNTVVNGTIYTYFVTGANASSTKSGPSFPLVVAVLVPPSGLNCTNCVNVSGFPTERAALSVPLAWTLPSPGITSQNGVWRAEGSFTTLAAVLSNLGSFTQVGATSGTPTAANFADSTVVNGKTYTYFVTDSTSTGVQSSPSVPVVVTVLVPPTGLHCTNCVLVKGVLKEKAGRSVPLAWTLPSPGITSQNAIWRATGSFPTLALVLANLASFSQVGTTSGTPSGAAFVDGTVANKTTYTYFVTDSTSGGVQSAPSNPVVVTVKACGDGADDCEDREELLLVLNAPTALEEALRAAWLINPNESARRFLGLDLRP